MIETERLILRDYRTSDFERVHLYGSIPEFSQYDVWGPNTEEGTNNFISESLSKSKQNPRYEFEFAICLKENELLIGGCGIRKESETSMVANLGYAINPEFQSKGYATEATKALIKFGFDKLFLSVIYATCDTRNTASFKVMEKAEMVRVGFIKKHKEVKGHIRDSYRYEVLNK
jgi:RimJ/RimL family protein N-acetyltransferase